MESASPILYWAKWPLMGEIILLMTVALPVARNAERLESLTRPRFSTIRRGCDELLRRRALRDDEQPHARDRNKS